MDNAKKFAEDLIVAVLKNPLGLKPDHIKKFIDRIEPCRLDAARIASELKK